MHAYSAPGTVQMITPINSLYPHGKGDCFSLHYLDKRIETHSMEELPQVPQLVGGELDSPFKPAHKPLPWPVSSAPLGPPGLQALHGLLGH